MARKPRIEYEGAFYHVLTRGNQKQKIFKDKYDFARYLEILSDYKNQFKYNLHAYALMDNHVHLLMETEKMPLSKIMQGINQRYTAYFNKKYRTVGHLFQGRYKAILCDKDAYVLSLIKYIHQNPVRAKVVTEPVRYQWSSHHGYVRKAADKDIVDTDQVLRMFSEDKTKARRLYRAYMGDGMIVEKEDIYSTIDQRILGSEQFADKVMKKYDVELNRPKRRKQYTLQEMARGIEKIYGVKLSQMRAKSKERLLSLGKKVFCVLAHEYGYSGREIARFMHKDPALISRYLKQKKSLKKEIEKIEHIMGWNG
jgi:REP element-mobilizing transposase RayT